MSSLLIKNASVVSPIYDVVKRQDIYIQDGIIKSIFPDINITADNVIDAEGLHAFPGFIDIHVHLRDPGFTHKEDIITGCDAAAAGGITTLVCMANTSPVADNTEVLEYIINKAEDAKVKVYPIAAVTKNLEGKELTDFATLKNAGAIAVSDDGHPIEDENVMEKALELACELDLPLFSHCEDLKIVKDGIINHGIISEKLDVPGIHHDSEDNITAREIALAEKTGAKIHIQHVSTKKSVELILDAKIRGINITAETAPHYFALTEDELLKKDADFRMNPPLRTQEDTEVILQGLSDGIIDCIVTDHAPHSPEEKADFLTAPNGIVGLETSFAVTLTYLYYKSNFSLMEIARLMSQNAGIILDIPHCIMQEGCIADIALVDINKKWTVDPQQFRSKSRNTPFKGQELTGKVITTIKNGEIIYWGL